MPAILFEKKGRKPIRRQMETGCPGQNGLFFLPVTVAILVYCLTTNGDMQSGSSVGACYTLRTRSCMFGADLHAQSVLSNKNVCVGAQWEVCQECVVGWVCGRTFARLLCSIQHVHPFLLTPHLLLCAMCKH